MTPKWINMPNGGDGKGNFSKLTLDNIREKAENKFKKFASLFREKLFVNLVCFADESGTHDTLGLQPGSEVAAVAGYLSWDTRWQIFCGQWQEVLARYGVKVFHYSDLANKKETYCDWPNEKIERFMRELISIARNNTIMGIGGLVSVQDYNAIILDSAKYDHPYHFCFDLFFGAIRCFLRNGSQWGYASPFMPNEKVTFIFDRQDEFKHKALEQYGHALTHDTAKRFGAIVFDSKEEHPELQAADLLVGRARIICTRIFKGGQPVSKNSWDEDLGSSGRILAMYYDANSLRNLVNEIQTEAKIYSE
jgi:hypothetical protein